MFVWWSIVRLLMASSMAVLFVAVRANLSLDWTHCHFCLGSDSCCFDSDCGSVRVCAACGSCVLWNFAGKLGVVACVIVVGSEIQRQGKAYENEQEKKKKIHCPEQMV